MPPRQVNLLVNLVLLVVISDAFRPLPAFSSDFTQVAISAIIERSFTGSLHLAVFLVGHKALSHMPQMPFLALNTASADWQAVANIWSNETNLGLSGSAMDCVLQHDRRFRSYTSQGHFIPSNTTEDSGFNRMLEVLRCPIDDRQLPQTFKTKKHLEVQILGGELHDEIRGMGRRVLFHFYVPWRSRVVGWGFNYFNTKSPLKPDKSSHRIRIPKFANSRFDPWKMPVSAHAYSDSPPTIHLCSPVLRPLEPNRKDPNLPMLLEFIEHNVRLGITHQFLGFFLDSKSKEFARVKQLVDPYIQEGKVSIASMAFPGFDGNIFIHKNHRHYCIYSTFLIDFGALDLILA